MRGNSGTGGLLKANLNLSGLSTLSIVSDLTSLFGSPATFLWWQQQSGSGWSIVLLLLSLLLAGWLLYRIGLALWSYVRFFFLYQRWEQSLPFFLAIEIVLRDRTVPSELEKCRHAETRGEYLEQSVKQILQYLNQGLKILSSRVRVCSQFVRLSPDSNNNTESMGLERVICDSELHQHDRFTAGRELDYLRQKSNTIYDEVIRAPRGIIFGDFQELMEKAKFVPYREMDRFVQSGCMTQVTANGTTIGCVAIDSPIRGYFPDGSYLLVKFAADAVGILYEVAETISSASARQSAAEKHAVSDALKPLQQRITVLNGELQASRQKLEAIVSQCTRLEMENKDLKRQVEARPDAFASNDSEPQVSETESGMKGTKVMSMKSSEKNRRSSSQIEDSSIRPKNPR